MSFIEKLKNFKERFKFVKTIRFKLTLLFTLILFMFSSLLVLSLNVYLTSHFMADPNVPSLPQQLTLNLPNGRVVFNNFNQLQQEERDRIQDIRQQDMRELQTISWLALFPVALLSFFLGYWVSGSFLSPISKLTGQFANLTRKDLGKTIPIEVDDEVGDLIASFNNLSSRLKHSFEVQEQFVQDASHELKTPLTVIQTNLDTVAYDDTATKEDLQESMRGALQGMKNLRKLSENLLELSEAENLEMSEVNLTELIEEQVSMLQPYAKNHKVRLSADLGKDPIKISANALALGRAVYNITENAIKYSTDSKKPEVKLVMTKVNKDKFVQIDISDNGPGIPLEAQKLIFKRFFRVDKSRARSSGGFGLGLAIAKKIVETHQGKISLQSEPGKTVFSILIPLI